MNKEHELFLLAKKEIKNAEVFVFISDNCTQKESL